MNKKIIIFFVAISIFLVLIAYISIDRKSKYNSTIDSAVAIMVYDDGIKDYVKANTVPKGNYELNEEKTKCIAGGRVGDYDSKNGTITYSLDTADQCYIYFDVLPGLTFVKYITEELYSSDGVNGLYYHDGQGSYTNANLEIGDNSYRYSGHYIYPKASDGYSTFESIIIITSDKYNIKNYSLAYDDSYPSSFDMIEVLNKATEDGYLEEEINNFVCFQGDDCSNENNLYRIIGVIDNKVKLIKYTNINIDNTLAWNSSDVNTWEGSTLETYLNDDYLNTLSFKDKIDNTTWSVGGFPADQLKSENAKGIYIAEMTSEPKLTNKKIGLMYVHEYMYAADPIYWNLVLYNKSATEDYRLSTGRNWNIDYSSFIEYMISRDAENTDRIYIISKDSIIASHYTYLENRSIRPTFNLKPSVKILNVDAEGVGTKDAPMIIG